MKEKTKKKISMKWRVFIYLALFSALLLLLLWLFQTVLFDSFYTTIKLRRTETADRYIQAILEEGNESMAADLVDISRNYDLCLLVLNSFFEPVASADSVPNCTLHSLDYTQLRIFYILALKSDGRYEMRWSDKVGQATVTYGLSNGADYVIGIGEPAPSKERALERIITAEIVTTSSGAEYIVFLNSVISPVTETVRTLRIQLVYISGIMLLMTAVLALVMSRRLSKPLSNMTDSAMQLATGDYGVHFDDATGYREIDQLGDTLNHAAKELSRVDHLRNELLANISHDLRTPLTMITGYGEMMRDLPGEANIENVDIIIEEARRLADLVNDALDISKLQSGEERLAPVSFNLTESVKSIVERIDALMGPKGYTVSFDYGEMCTVTADEIKVSQVVYNLVNNALNYTGEDRAVRVKQVREADSVKIEVTDAGPGIAEKDLPFIFDRYYKGESAKRTAIGTGLGLAIVKAVLELHGAEYGVTSQKGAGSTFWFQLKVDDPEE